MKKLLFSLIAISAICIGFTSCSDDDDDDYNKSNISGSYIGTVNVISGNTDKTVADFPVSFAPDSKNTSILLTTLGNRAMQDSVALFVSNVTASSFVDQKTVAKFNLDAITMEFKDSDVPQFMNDQVAFEVKDVVVTLKKTSVIYTIATETLTFTYTGGFTAKGAASNQTYGNDIKYIISVTKQK